MKVAVIGSGIAGISAAWHLAEQGAAVELYEAGDRLGGHTHTHEVFDGKRKLAVDTGFIVFNESHYPSFNRWLGQLGVDSQPSDMSFAVSDQLHRIEYGSTAVAAFAANPSQLLQPGYWRMWRDLRRFYRDNGAGPVGETSLGSYLHEHGYSQEFIHSHIAPMCAALWSQPATASLELSLDHVIGFMRNHNMLQINGRPQWRVVQGGSSAYLDNFRERFNGTVHLNEPAQVSVREHAVVVFGARGVSQFDAAVLACHSDQALSALRNPTREQVQTLVRMPYQSNMVYLHGDQSFMPKRRACWSSWNVQRDRSGTFTVSYWMNRLQTLDSQQQFFVTLNPTREPRNIFWQGRYEHPHFTAEAERAKRERWNIATPRLSFAGAYWGSGFHEDGFVSGREAAEHLVRRTAHAA